MDFHLCSVISLIQLLNQIIEQKTLICSFIQYYTVLSILVFLHIIHYDSSMKLTISKFLNKRNYYCYKCQHSEIRSLPFFGERKH